LLERATTLFREPPPNHRPDGTSPLEKNYIPDASRISKRFFREVTVEVIPLTISRFALAPPSASAKR